jgi:hypothetical protein
MQSAPPARPAGRFVLGGGRWADGDGSIQIDADGLGALRSGSGWRPRGPPPPAPPRANCARRGENFDPAERGFLARGRFLQRPLRGAPHPPAPSPANCAGERENFIASRWTCGIINPPPGFFGGGWASNASGGGGAPHRPKRRSPPDAPPLPRGWESAAVARNGQRGGRGRGPSSRQRRCFSLAVENHSQVVVNGILAQDAGGPHLA